MRAIRMKRFGITGVAAATLALLLSQRHFGFLLVLEAIVLVPWLAYSAYIIAVKAERRSDQLAVVLIWLMSVAVVVSVHVFLAYKTRRNADEVVQLVKNYLGNYGRCASTLEALGLSKEVLRAKVGISYYGCDVQGKPSFSYAVTYVLFEKYLYDFDEGMWRYIPD